MKNELVESQIDISTRPNDAAHSLMAEVNSSRGSYDFSKSTSASNSHLPELSIFESNQPEQKSAGVPNNSEVVLATSLTFTHNGQPVVLSNGGYPIVVPRK
jgi:hypothetical protein